MSMLHDWFYHAEIPAVGSIAELDAAEARHALGARRMQVGETITVFDGRGTSATATLKSADKRRTVVEIADRTSHARPTRSITLASALPKGDRQAVLLSMAAQLGITRFIPLQCERSVAKVSKGFESRTWRIVIEACKQSRQAFVPTIESTRSPSDAAREAHERGAMIVVAHPSGCALREIDVAQRSLILLVGPEGGFTDAEVDDVVRAGAQLASLGENILRTETAAVALLTWAHFAP